MPIFWDPLSALSVPGGGVGGWGIYSEVKKCTELWFVTNAFLCVVHFRARFSNFRVICHYFLQSCCYLSMRYPLTRSGNYASSTVSVNP
jgi:hypothetical protein